MNSSLESVAVHCRAQLSVRHDFKACVMHSVPGEVLTYEATLYAITTVIRYVFFTVKSIAKSEFGYIHEDDDL